MGKALILAHDLGTTGNKASLYNGEGQILANSLYGYGTEYPHVNWVEQNPENWWTPVCETTKQLFRDTHISPNEIACIVFSGQMMGAVAVDRHAHPMRNAIIWADTRCGRGSSPLRTQVRHAVERAWSRAIDACALAPLPEADAPTRIEVEIDRPANPDHGDFASNLAMKLARPYRRPPLEIARAIAAELAAEIEHDRAATPIGSVEVAPPGFLNLRLADHALAATVDGILASPGAWGRVETEGPRAHEHVDVEFVSANPTGPLTIGNARGAFTGDLLCRVLGSAPKRAARRPGPRRGSRAGSTGR